MFVRLCRHSRRGHLRVLQPAGKQEGAEQLIQWLTSDQHISWHAQTQLTRTPALAAACWQKPWYSFTGVPSELVTAKVQRQQTQRPFGRHPAGR